MVDDDGCDGRRTGGRGASSGLAFMVVDHKTSDDVLMVQEMSNAHEFSVWNVHESCEWCNNLSSRGEPLFQP